MEKVVSPVNVEERRNLGIKAGDTVRVWQKIKEGDKTRLQAFEGIVLARKHGNESGATFTVRKVSAGVGIEKIFPLFSPMIDKIEILKRAKVRKARLYHIRDRAAKEIRRQMRNMMAVDVATSSDTEEKMKAEETEKQEKAPTSSKDKLESRPKDSAEKENKVEENSEETSDKSENESKEEKDSSKKKE